MKALVTGANGFIGAALVRRLAREGAEIRVLARPSSNLESLKDSLFERRVGDVTDAASVKAAVQGMDAVFHLAGIRRTPNPDDFRWINVEGTRSVLRAAAEEPNPPRVVLAGSLSAVGPSTNSRPLDEEAVCRPVEAYGRSKVDAEVLCREYSDRVPVAIGRPPRVLGPGDRENLAFVKMVSKGFLLEISGGPRPLSMVDVEDVAEGFFVLGTHPGAAGQTFFLSSAESISIEEIQEKAASILGRIIKHRIRVSPGALRMSARVADAISTVSGSHLPLNRKLAEQLLAPGWICDPTKAAKQLGFKARHLLSESVERSVRWYVEQGLVS